jgi:hypothetical protein
MSVVNEARGESSRAGQSLQVNVLYISVNVSREREISLETFCSSQSIDRSGPAVLVDFEIIPVRGQIIFGSRNQGSVRIR